MGVRIQQYTGQKFITTMPETGNQNPHHTLFAGSLFSLATLTGWGLIWLMLRERHLGGTIILADAHIRYSKPISGKPHAVADLGALSGDLDRLARGRKARVQMQVEIFGDETPGAVFEGTYIVLPAKPFGPYEEGGTKKSRVEILLINKRFSRRLKRSLNALIWRTVSARRPLRILLTLDLEPSSCAKSAALSPC